MYKFAEKILTNVKYRVDYVIKNFEFRLVSKDLVQNLKWEKYFFYSKNAKIYEIVSIQNYICRDKQNENGVGYGFLWWLHTAT